MSWLWAFYKWQQSLWGAIKRPPNPQSPCFFVYVFLNLYLCVFVLVFVHVPMSLCLCDILLVLDQNTLRPLLQSILVFVCLMEQERGEGGAAPHIFKHHFYRFSFIEGGRNYSLCLSPSFHFSRVALKWLQTKDNEAAMLFPHVVN